MRPGKLRHRVEILHDAGVTQNALGEHAEDWRTLDKVWASVEPLQGRLLFAAQQFQSEVTTKITMRWRGDVTPANRLRYGGRVFTIVSSINVEQRDRELQLMCKELA